MRQLIRGFLLATLVAIMLVGTASITVAQGGPFSAQIQAALRVFLRTANTWPGGQTFNNITITSFVNAVHTHQNAAGGGLLAEAALLLTDIATNNASISNHGFAPKLPGGTALFYRADGTFANPGGTAMCVADVCTYSTGSTLTGVSDGFWRFRTSGGVGSGFTIRAASNFLDVLNDAVNDYGGIRIGTLNIAGRTAVGTTGGLVYSAGFGVGATGPGSTSGAWTFTIGTAPSTTGTITALPFTSSGWAITCTDLTNVDAIVVAQTASTTSGVSLKFYSRTSGLATAPTASDVISCQAWGY